MKTVDKTKPMTAKKVFPIAWNVICPACGSDNVANDDGSFMIDEKDCKCVDCEQEIVLPKRCQ